MYKKYGYLIITLILSVFLISCDVNKKEVVKKDQKRDAVIVQETGGYIVNAITRDAITLNPVLINDSTSQQVSDMIYEGLVKYDKDLKLIGVLAETWETLDQGLEVIFHLKKNVKWHDGELFTAYDVKFTYDTIMKFKNYNSDGGDMSQLYTLFEYVDDVNILDDYTIKVSYKVPFARTIEIWSIGIIPRHIFGQYDDLKDFIRSDYNRKPVGTGKYRLNKWLPDERIILEVNRNYHGKVPYIDKLIFSINPEQTIIYLDTMLGKIDISSLTPTQFTRLLDDEEKLKKLMAVHYTGGHYMYLGYNMKVKKLSDQRVRKALTLAINRQEIIDGVLEGLGQICYGPFLPYSWAFNKDIKPLPYDVAKAAKLMHEAGWRDSDDDGILDKDGKPFELEVVVDRSEPNRNMALKFIKRNLKDIGVRMIINPVSWTTLVQNHMYAKNFDAVMVGWQLNKDPDVYNIWHTDGALNFYSYSNKEVDRLLEKGRKTFDRAIRKECYNRIHSLIMDDMPYTFLYIDDILVSINRRIKGVKVSESGLNSISDWYVKYRTVMY